MYWPSWSDSNYLTQSEFDVHSKVAFGWAFSQNVNDNHSGMGMDKNHLTKQTRQNQLGIT